MKTKSADDGFRITHKDIYTKARAGVLTTPHGEIETPVFMPVGTQATVKTLAASEVAEMGYPVLLGNTYHLFLRPGLDILKKAGGLHAFMGWNRSILTDSGGFQVFSLSSRRKMLPDGVEFSSHVDGKRHTLTPEIATEFQLEIGSDIVMCFDDCPPYPTLKEEARRSLDLTARWGGKCQRFYREWRSRVSRRSILFGITQGAGFPDLRKESSRRMVDLNFEGYAVGGLGVGEPAELTWTLLEASLEPLPEPAPHYLMGFGKPEDIWEGVERGIDMFDCVLPTRNGRNGQAFTSEGRIHLMNSRFRQDFGPLDPAGTHPALKNLSRAYLCHLFRSGELLGARLVTLHNLWFMISLLRNIRKSVINGSFREEKEKFCRRIREREHVAS